MGIVWIASYPKSGNTWIRFLLASYLVGPIASSEQVESAVPGCRPGLSPGLGRLFVKTHYPWTAAHPYAASTEGAVVVLRNPRDVLLSNLNYHRLVHGSEDGFTDATYARAFLAAGGDPLWLKHGYGRLADHVVSWLDAPNLRRLIVRYDDLKSDSAAVLSKILNFLGLPRDEEKIRRAAAESSFESMRAMEEREKATNGQSAVFSGKPPRPGWSRYFVSEGRLGSNLDRIQPGLDRGFEEYFGALLVRLGYARGGQAEPGPPLSFPNQGDSRATA